MNSLSNIFSKTNLLFIELLVEGPSSIRELAEKLECSPAKASQAVKQFLEKGLVKTKREKNKKLAFLNRENPLTKQIISLIFIDNILESKTFNKLKKKAKGILAYGSVVEGTIDKRSDIDLCVLSDKKPTLIETTRIENNLTKELGKETSIIVLTDQGLEKLKKKDKIFFDELRCKSRVLYGEGIE